MTLLLAMVLVAVAVAAPVAYAKVVNGTGGDDLLVGTNNADEITGRGGDDRTRGKQGDDTYNYASGWGRDVVVDSGGRDGLDFSAVDEDLVAYLCPGETFNYKDLGRARDSAGNLVRYSSRIEKIQGGSGNDLIYGCGANNTLSGGGNGGGDLLSGFNGQIDVLADLGGCNQQGINLPASDDVYAGFMGGSATWVLDTGGKEDVVNLGNFSSKSVRMTRVDIDKDGIKGSLRILFDDTKEHGLLIINQFEPMRPASWPGAT